LDTKSLIIGAVIPLVSAVITLLSVWFASYLTEKRVRRKQREEFCQVIARQQALVHRSSQRNDLSMTLTDTYQKWLDEKSPNPATLAFVVEYLRQANEQIDSLVKEIENRHAEIDRLRAQEQNLKQQLAGKTDEQAGDFKEP
jgi:hypothetical protein